MKTAANRVSENRQKILELQKELSSLEALNEKENKNINLADFGFSNEKKQMLYTCGTYLRDRVDPKELELVHNWIKVESDNNWEVYYLRLFIQNNAKKPKYYMQSYYPATSHLTDVSSARKSHALKFTKLEARMFFRKFRDINKLDVTSARFYLLKRFGKESSVRSDINLRFRNMEKRIYMRSGLPEAKELARKAVNGSVLKKGYKEGSFTEDLIGIDSDSLKEYIEKKFEPWMNWKNHGQWQRFKKTWHLDHIIPLDAAETVEQMYKLNHYTNLQPLEARENLSKSNKIAA